MCLRLKLLDRSWFRYNRSFANALKKDNSLCKGVRSMQGQLTARFRPVLTASTATRLMSIKAMPESTVGACPALQQLYRVAKQSLQGISQPSSAILQQLQSIAGNVTLEEVGFDSSIQQDPASITEYLRKTSRNHPFLRGEVTYLHIFEDAAFSMGVFMLPAGTSIPLHDHPDMNVISHLLFGTLHVTAFDHVQDSTTPTTNSRLSQEQTVTVSEGRGDSGPVQGQRQSQEQASTPGSTTWSKVTAGVKRRFSGILNRSSGKDDHQQEAGRSWAELKVDTTITAPTKTMILQPSSCNIHEFTAVTDCAILDLLTPPYSPSQGRDCTYYRYINKEQASPKGQAAIGSHVLLEAYDNDTFFTRNAPYTGIKVE